MNDTCAIELHNVQLTLGNTRVLHDVNLTVNEGEFISVVGPNGGGKTSLLKVILGLFTPEKGTVRILGRPCEAARPLIGYVPQHAHYDPQFPIRVRDAVLLGRLRPGNVLGPYSREDRTAAEKALENVNLRELGQRPFASLSGGQQQRVLIARALASAPRILLLDEPTSNLDFNVEESLSSLLQTIQQKMTILLVSHDIAFVNRLIDRVICVNQVVATHPTAQLTPELLHEMYGGDIAAVQHDRHQN